MKVGKRHKPHKLSTKGKAPVPTRHFGGGGYDPSDKKQREAIAFAVNTGATPPGGHANGGM